MENRSLTKEEQTADVRSQIYADEVKQLYDNAPLGMAATLINAPALIYILWNVVPHGALIIWLASLLLITVLRSVHIYRYRRNPGSPAETRGWGLLFILGMALAGIAWGSAGIFLLPSESLAHQIFLVFVLGGMVAGAAGVFSILRAAFLSFSIPALAPVILRFFSFGDEIHVTIGGMTLLFAILIHVMAFRVHGVSALSLKLRYENKSLVAYLASAKEKAETLNEELRNHQDNLEKLVRERTAEWSEANARLQEEMAARRVAEDLRRRSEVHFQSLIENALDIITVLDNNGNIVFESPSIEKQLGYTREELIGSSVFDFLHPEDRPAAETAFTRIVLSPGSTESIEVRVRHKNGSWRFVEAIGKGIVDDTGTASVILNSRDITERRRMEEEILKAQKLDSLGVLAGGIAHDFNNIITGIMANIDLAKMQAGRDKDLAVILQKAEQASARARDLAQQLLTFSRGGEPIRKAVMIGELVRESANFALKGSTSRCTFSLPDDLWSVDGDAGQLRQVVHNIVINADQSMPDGGIIRITGENISAGARELQALKLADYVKISIADEGIGIPQEHRAKIFDPYFTTKQKGSGLGLATAYSIIKKHNGDIAVESVLGSGTNISVYLPAALKSPEEQPEAGTGYAIGKGRILIMDDEEIVRDVAGRILQTVGYEVEFARDGSEAIERYRNARETGKPFDAVILDLTIPGGMGGKDTIKKLLEIDPAVKALVSSGYSHDPIMARYRDYGFTGVIAKPYRVKELCEIVGKATASS